jgi:Dolichyl-phosphate-mannose-protein mannosyltransferase
MNSLISRFRMPAVLCAITFTLCEAVSRPYAEMGVCDDWSYIRTAHLLAQTGHIHYIGWASAMIGWQLYPAALFLKLFGFSFTAARLSTFLVAVLTTFLIQRTFVRAGVNERNATIGTLAIVLTPLYMALSVTFMTDVEGLFAIVICLYGCLRALQASSSSAATAWICFAALANAVFGSSRQIAWLGVLVMVPCTLWFLRHQRRTLMAGSVATLAGWAFIALSLHWFHQQPYALPESVLFKVTGPYQLGYMARELFGAVLEVPFLLLPIIAAYLILLRRRNSRQFWTAFAVCGLGYALAAVVFAIKIEPNSVIVPTLGDWVSPLARYGVPVLGKPGPIVLDQPTRILLTAVSTLATLCAIAFLWEMRRRVVRDEADQGVDQEVDPQAEVLSLTPRAVSWNQVMLLVGPFAAAYFALLIPRSSNQLYDRYLLPLVFLSGVGLIRAFQNFVQPCLPAVTTVLVGLVAIYSIGATHDMFAFYRARVTVAEEVRAAGVQPNTFDGGFEYNGWVELLPGGYVNDENILNRPNSYVPIGPYRGPSCDGSGKIGADNKRLLHFSPQYGLSFYPNACAGQTPLAPVSYFRWLGLRSASLYVVNYQPMKGH